MLLLPATLPLAESPPLLRVGLLLRDENMVSTFTGIMHVVQLRVAVLSLRSIFSNDYSL